MARSEAMSWWGRSRLAKRTIWMRSRYLGSVSRRKAWSSRWDSSCGKRMRITLRLPSRGELLYPPSLYAPDSLTERVYQGKPATHPQPGRRFLLRDNDGKFVREFDEL